MKGEHLLWINAKKLDANRICPPEKTRAWFKLLNNPFWEDSYVGREKKRREREIPKIPKQFARTCFFL